MTTVLFPVIFRLMTKFWLYCPFPALHSQPNYPVLRTSVSFSVIPTMLLACQKEGERS